VEKKLKKSFISILLIFVTVCAFGNYTKEIELNILNEDLAIPTIASIELYIDNPIYQDITRSVFFESKINTVMFSTLESYKPDGSGHNFLMVASKIDSLVSNDHESIKIKNSREARSCTSGELLNEYFCGTSLIPQVIKLNTDYFSSEIIYRNDDYSGWIHGLASDRNGNLYFINSSGVYLPDGVNKINIYGGDYRYLHHDLLLTTPYTKTSSQTYGGVDLIDQNGVVWFWKAYPWQQVFLLPDGSEMNRNIDGWSAEGFEKIYENIYHVFTNKNGDFDKRKILDTFSDERFDNFINVDLQFRSYNNSKVIYFDQSSNQFYIFNKDDNSWSNPISNEFGEPMTEFMLGKDKEAALLWFHPEYGGIKIIGATENDEIIGWQYGRKSFFLLSDEKNKYEIDINNLSPAEITGLAYLQGKIYGSGNLTWSHIFSYSPEDLEVLKDAIPNNEGQIDLLFTGMDGYLYGMGYPGAKVFRYNPDLSWNPGNDITSNPKSCGALNGQTRGIKGFRDSIDSFYLTESDYSALKITSISKIDINTCKVTQRTDLEDSNHHEDSYPSIKDIVDIRNGELLAVGKSDGSSVLMIIDKNNLDIIDTANIDGEKHTLFSSKSFTKSLIGFDSSVCIIQNNLELSSCLNLNHNASKIYELGSYALIFGLEDLTIVDNNLNIVNSYTSASLGLNEFFPYLSLMHVVTNNNELFFSNYTSVYKIIFNDIH